MTATTSSIHEDTRAGYATRGAVTVIGIGMGSFLVGCLGFMIGSAKAMLIHDYLQETSDAVTFAGSASQGRGMNLISSLNLIMLLLVAIFVVLSVIVDILRVGLLALIACASTIFGAPICSPLIGVTETVSETLARVRDGYGRVMQPVLHALSFGQTAVAVVTPVTAQVTAIRTAIKYKQVGTSFSPSNLPFGMSLGHIPGVGGGGGAGGGGLGGLPHGGFGGGGFGGGGFGGGGFGGGGFGGGGGARIGLPVAQEQMGQLCAISGGYVLNKIKSMLNFIPGIGQIIHLPGVGKAINKGLKSFTLASRYRYCSGGFWDHDGPKKMFSPAENGNDWLQTWSFVLNGRRVDPDQKYVDVGARIFSLHAQPKVTMPNFFAQSEFFFDCDSKWGSDRCNGAHNAAVGHYDQAVYSLKWRSRLRRFHTPQFGDFLGGFMKKYFGQHQFGSYLGGNTQGLGAVQQITNRLGSESEFANDGLDEAKNIIPGGAQDPFGFAGSKINQLQAQQLSKIPGAGGATSAILH